MTDKQKYQILTAAVVLTFVYLLFTEIANRWSEAYSSYEELSVKRARVLNPEEMALHKMELLAKKRILTAQMTRANEGFEQSQIGVVRLIQTRAKGKNILLRTLTPLEARPVGQMMELGFALDLLCSYHRLGDYVNSLETGPMPIKITKVEAISQQPGSAVLSVSIQGKAYILPKSVLQ